MTAATELEIRAPWDDALLGQLPLMSWTELDTRLALAEKLARRTEGPLTLLQRIQILEGTLQRVVAGREKFALCAAREGGKPLADSLVELDRAAEGIRMAIVELKSDPGRILPMGFTASSASRLAFTQREPLGPVLAISAFNHPFNLIVHQAITAVAAGCPVIIKPALVTPLSCQNLLNCLYEAGLPEAWCQFAFCEDALTARMAADSRLSFLSFIGSASVGWKLRAALAPGVRCVLEHGGAAPVIVAEDADIADAVPLLAKGGMYHAGQVCVSVQRIYVQHKIAHQFADALANETKNQKTGDPTSPETQLGPLIRSTAIDRVEQWTNEAIAAGATRLCGGSRVGHSCYEPTVLYNVSDDCRVMREEIFGPVICVNSCSSLDEAIEKANALPFAFQSAAFCKSLDTAMRLQRQLRANAVMVNDHTAFRVDWMPFGGSEHAGLGIGGIAEAIRDMSREKLVIINSKEL